MTIVVVTAVAVGVLAAVGYAFRERLAETTLVATVFDRLGWRPDAGSLDTSYWSCPMHPDVHEHGPGACPICGMTLQEVTAAPSDTGMADMNTMTDMTDMTDMVMPGESAGLARAEVQIDPRRQQLIGVRTGPVERRALTQPIRAVGTVRYDETRLADINVKVSGWIEELYVDYTGQFVEEGQPLFTLYSQELLSTQQEYLLALESRDQLRESQIADARVYADRIVDAARQRLALWDLPPDLVQALADGREPSHTIPFRSPVGGFVIEKRVVQGQHISAGQSLYTVADLSEVWVEADLYEEELSLVREGARATVTVAAYQGERFQARVIYIYPYVEEQTRTVRVRLALSNPNGRLKPGMYADVTLDVSLGEGVVVPTNALLDSGAEQHVFVAQGDGYFEPRPVVVGRRLGDSVQILDGLEGGETVATSATFFIDSESQLRSALQGFEPLPRLAEGGAGRERLDISFQSDPDPPRSGENTLEVRVLDPTGQPVTDADVTVIFFMAPMPTMNMPAMQSDAALSHQGAGVYQGEGEVMMAGRWDVTVQVSRAGQPLDSHVFTVVAR
jgi:RND family efflux transporter MFP subunit